MRNRIIAIILVICAFSMVLLTGCNTQKKDEEKTKLTVLALKGPTGIGLSGLWEKSENGKTHNDYSITLTSDTSEVSAAAIAGNYDIIAMPVNLASVVKNKGAEYSFLAVNTLGVLYVVENGNSINSLEDLKGKTIYTTGQGATPEYIINYVLKSNNIDPENDLKLEFVADTSEISSKLAAGTIDVAIIPEPFVTSTKLASKTGNYRVALNMTQEWDKISSTPLVQGVVVVKTELLKENPLAVGKFLFDYRESVNYVNNNVEEASKTVAKYGIVPSDKVALNAIPNCNIVCVNGENGVKYMKGMLSVLFEANPKSIGGKMPSEDFFAVVNVEEK